MLVLTIKNNDALKISVGNEVVYVKHGLNKNELAVEAKKEIGIERVKNYFSGLGDNGQEPKHSGTTDVIHENEELE